jgi:tetratricopeptide (TPR) repeat protein
MYQRLIPAEKNGMMQTAVSSQIDHLKVRFRRNPNDDEAYLALRSALSQHRDFASLAEVIEAHAASVGASDRNRASLEYRESAELAVQAGDRAGKAQDLYRNALRLNPLNQPAAEGFQWLLEDRQQYQDLAEFLQSYIPALEETEGKDVKYLALLKFRLGELWNKRFEFSDLALTCYLDAFDLDASLLAAAFEAREICLANGDLTEAADLYDFEAAAETNLERKTVLLSEAAGLRGRELNDLDGAITTLQTALSFAPDNVELMTELCDYCIKKAETADPAQAGTHYQSAAKALFHLARAETETASLNTLRSALKYAPDYLAALEYLEDLACNLDEERSLPEYWVRYLASAPETAASDVRRVKLAEAYERANQLEDAIFCLEPAAQRGNAQAKELLEELQQRRGGTVPGIDLNDLALSRQSADDAENRTPSEIIVNRPSSDPIPTPVVLPVVVSSVLSRKDTPRPSSPETVPRHPEPPIADTGLLELIAEPEPEPPTSDEEDLLSLELGLRDSGEAISSPQTGSQTGSTDATKTDANETSRAQPVAARPQVAASPHARPTPAPVSASPSFWPKPEPRRPSIPVTSDHKEQSKTMAGSGAMAAHPQNKRQPSSSSWPPVLPKTNQARPEPLAPAPDGDSQNDREETKARTVRGTRGRIAKAELAKKEAQSSKSAGFERQLVSLEKLEADAIGPERIALLTEMADIAARRLNDHQRAVAYLTQAYELDPEIPEIFKRLCDSLDKCKRYPELAARLQEQAKAETDAEASSGFFRQAALILTNQVHDEHGATAAWQGVLACKEDREALEFLRWQALRRNDNEKLVALLGRLAALETDRIEKRDLLYDQARLLNGRLKRPSEAVPVLKQILDELEPSFELAIDELVKSAEMVGDSVALGYALERRLDIKKQPEARVRISRKLAELYQKEDSKDLSRAVRALWEWIKAGGQNPEPFRQLRKIYSEQEQWRDLVTVLDKLAAMEPEQNAKREAALRACEVVAIELGDIDIGWNRALALVSQRVEGADKLLRELALRYGRENSLCDFLERAGKHRELVTVLQEWALRETDTDARVAIFRRLARTARQLLKNRSEEKLAWQSILALKEDPEGLEFLRQDAIERNDPEALAASLQRLAEVSDQKSVKRDLLLEYSRVLRLRLKRERESIDPLRRILDEVEPGCKPALDELLAACEAIGDHSAWTETLELQLALEKEPKAAETLAKQLLEVYRRDRRNQSKEIAVYQRWAEVDRTNTEPFQRLAPLLEAEQRWHELLSCLDSLAGIEDRVEARHDAALRAAQVVYAKLLDGASAIERLLTLVEQNVPTAEEAMSAVAAETGRLERVRESFEGAGKYASLVKLLNERAKVEREKDALADLYRNMAVVLSTQLADETGAEGAWERVLSLQEDKEGLWFVLGQAVKRRDFERQSEILKRLIALEQDTAAERDLLLERAKILNGPLKRPREAIELLLKILEELHAEYEPAIEELITASEAVGDPRLLADALERCLVSEHDSVKRTSLAQRLAELCEHQLNDLPRAIRAVQAWSSAENGRAEPLRLLQRLFKQTERWQEMVSTLDRLVELESDATDRAFAEVLAAQVTFENLHDPKDAWQRLVPLLQKGDIQAVDMADRLALNAGWGEALGNLYVTAAQQSTDARTTAIYWDRAVKSFEDYSGKIESAFEASLRKLATDLDNRGFLSDVERLAIKLEAWPRLGQVYGRLIKEASDNACRVELHLRYADILQDKAKNPDAAIAQVMEAGKIGPNNPAWLDRAEAICQVSGNHAELLAIYERRSLNAKLAAERVSWRLRAARLTNRELKDNDKAYKSLEKALTESEFVPELMEAVENAAREMDGGNGNKAVQQARRSLAETYRRLALATNTVESDICLLRGARMLSEELRDEARAFELLRDGVSRFPANQEIYTACEASANKIGRLDALDALLSRLTKQMTNGSALVAILERRAQLLQDRLRRYDEAANVYLKLLEIEPSNKIATENLKRCFEKTGRYLELVRRIDKEAQTVENGAKKIGLLKEMASIWEKHLMDRWEAVEIWNHVLTVQPNDQEAQNAIERLNKHTPVALRASESA